MPNDNALINWGHLVRFASNLKDKFDETSQNLGDAIRAQVSEVNETIADNKNELKMIESDFYIRNNTSYDNTNVASSTNKFPHSYKWIIDTIPGNSFVESVKLVVAANSLDIVKLEIWEKTGNTYSLKKTVKAESISQVTNGYMLTFASFTAVNDTILTFSDASANGWVIYDIIDGYSVKKFDPSLEEVTDNDITSTTKVKGGFAVNYFALIPKVDKNSEEIETVKDAVFDYNIVEIDNTNVSSPSKFPLTYKWIIGMFSANSTINELAIVVTGNSLDIVKLEIWEKTSGKYSLSKTVKAKTIEEVSNGYLLTFDGFTISTDTILTFSDASANGWVKYDNVTGYSIKKFNASLTEVTDSDITSTNTVKGGFLLNYTVRKTRINNNPLVYVDANGKGDYTNIIEAVEKEASGTTIIVMPGIYEGTIRAFSKRINIIGTDREKCVIRSIDGRYEYPAIECCCGYLENLTVESKYINNISHEISTSETGAYAIHCENQYGNDSLAIGDGLTLHNCKVISDFFPALGVGTFKNWSINIDNCELISRQTEDRSKYSDQGGLGAFYCHDMNGEKGTAEINIKDTVIKSETLKNTLCIYDLQQEGAAIKCTFINNTIYSAVDKFSDSSIWFRGVTTAFNGNISLDDISHGNTVSVLNS